MINLLLSDKILLSIDDYKTENGFSALGKALEMSPLDVVNEIKDSHLIGRGGAGFPTGLKMSFVASNDAVEKYIICNADEGEPGTFKDRELLNNTPFKVIEGMIIAAYAVGATKGYLYVRGEYRNLKEIIIKAIDDCRINGYLGNNICGSDYNFDIEYRSGTGAYICGEETALIESIEGRSGDPRVKPPYTAEKGVFGKPTLVNNVETLVNLIPILNLGAEEYKTHGTKESSGTKLFSVSGSVKNRGVYEVPFGTKLSELLYDYCGGVLDDGKIKFVQIGGSSGGIMPLEMIDIELSYESLQSLDSNLGSGAIFVADESVCILDFLKATSNFFKHESCGKCTPCREGNRHIVKILNKFSSGDGSKEDIDTLLLTCNVMKEASFCGLGQTASTAIVSGIKYFENEIIDHLNGVCKTGVCDLKLGGGK